MNLIDRNKIPYREYLGDDEPRVYKSEIDAMPTVNAVSVVHCGECTHQEYCKQFISVLGADSVHPITFCSYGERREDDHEQN